MVILGPIELRKQKTFANTIRIALFVPLLCALALSEMCVLRIRIYERSQCETSQVSVSVCLICNFIIEKR